MLRIYAQKSVAAAKSYPFSNLEYYSEGQEMIGLWGGKGAARLGLKGTVTQKDYNALCDNLHPGTGEQLTARMKANRIVGYDFNFNAPKSVSVVHALYGDERILDAFRRAVNETMQEIEAQAQTRVRTAGANHNRETGGLVWGEFIHLTTRPVEGIPDPHMHAHLFAFNATFDPVEETWKAANFRNLKEEGHVYQTNCLNRFSAYLNELGYETEKRGIAFEIKGVPEAVKAMFSRRTAEIKRVQEELGITDGDEADQLGARTRERKNKEINITELRRLWRERLTPERTQAMKMFEQMAERTARTGKRLPVRTHFPVMTGKVLDTGPATEAEQIAIRYAILHSFEKKSAISQREFVANVLQFEIGRFSVERVDYLVARLPGLIHKEHEGRMMVTSPEVLAEEQAIVAWAKAGKGAVRPLAPGYSAIPEYLSPEQRAAMTHILNSRDKITGVHGKSGAGKT